MDEELKRNGSGYYDETAYKAMTAGPQPGEIWKRDDGRVLVILMRRESICSTLLLKDTDGAKTADEITVNAMVPMRTSPIMVGYAFAERMAQYVKKVPDKEFQAIRRMVGAALGLPMQRSTDDGRRALEEKCACLEAENKDLKEGYSDLYRKNEELRAELASRKTVSAEDEKAHCLAEIQRDMYRDMYRDLLERIAPARGEAQ